MQVSPDVAAGVMVLSSALFFAGAALPPEPSRVFSAPLDEHLRIVERHRRQWIVMNSLMIASILATSVGLVLLAIVQANAGDDYRAIVAATAYALAGVQWSLALSFRQTTMIAVAEEVAGGRQVPDWLPPLQRWTGQMFWVYMLVAYACMALLGWSLLETADVSHAVGWFVVGFGIVAAIGFVTTQPRTPFGPIFEVPLLVHVVPLVIGIALWL